MTDEGQVPDYAQVGHDSEHVDCNLISDSLSLAFHNTVNQPVFFTCLPKLLPRRSLMKGQKLLESNQESCLSI